MFPVSHSSVRQPVERCEQFLVCLVSVALRVDPRALQMPVKLFCRQAASPGWVFMFKLLPWEFRTPLSARWKRVCIASLATLRALGTLINVIKVTFLVSSRFFKVQHFHVFVCFCHCIYLCCKRAVFLILLLCSVLLQGTSAHSVVQAGPEITAV